MEKKTNEKKHINLLGFYQLSKTKSNAFSTFSNLAHSQILPVAIVFIIIKQSYFVAMFGCVLISIGNHYW